MLPAVVVLLGFAGSSGLTSRTSLPVRPHAVRPAGSTWHDPVRDQRDAQAAICRRKRRDCGLPILKPADGPITASGPATYP